MRAGDRELVAGGLALLLAGLVHGLWLGVSEERSVRAEIGAAFAGAFERAAVRDGAGRDERLERLARRGFDALRDRSVHAHLGELGTLALLLPLFSDRLRWPAGRRVAVARVFLGGSLLFAAGILAQSGETSASAELVAGTGAALVTVCAIALAVAVARGGGGAPRDAA